MAAGWTAHGWSWQEGWLDRGPPWPPAQMGYNRLPVDARAIEGLACAQTAANRGARGMANQWGGLMTG